MVIELPGIDFENLTQMQRKLSRCSIRFGSFLIHGVSRNEYTLGSQIAAGFGERVIQKVNDFWLICTTERGTNFDVSIFSNEFYAINYFIFRLTGEKETINWSTI